MKKPDKRITRGEKIFIALDYAVLFFLAVVILLPLFAVLSTSMVSAAEVARRGQFILWPEQLDFTSYRMLLGRGSSMWHAYQNTLLIVGAGTALDLIMTLSMAYPLSKKALKGRIAVLGMVFVTMLFNGGLIANYMWYKRIGLLNTRWVLIVPGLISAWNMLLMRNFFYAIPESLEEAAYLDGAGVMRTIVSVVLPLSLPSIATIGLFYAVGHWNAWFGGVMFITDNSKLPVQNLLRTIITEATASLQDSDLSNLDDATQMPTAQTIKNAAIVISTVPILCVYPFIQKYFVKGVMVGSVKG